MIGTYGIFRRINENIREQYIMHANHSLLVMVIFTRGPAKELVSICIAQLFRDPVIWACKWDPIARGPAIPITAHLDLELLLFCLSSIFLCQCSAF